MARSAKFERNFWSGDYYNTLEHKKKVYHHPKVITLDELRLGWEIMLDEPNKDLRSPRLALGGSRAVLVEFPLSGVPEQGGAELHRIHSSGVVPVLAHPERYWGCTAAKVHGWRQAGAVIQMDTAGLLGKGRIARMSRELLEHGLGDYAPRPAHPTRAPGGT